MLQVVAKPQWKVNHFFSESSGCRESIVGEAQCVGSVRDVALIRSRSTPGPPRRYALRGCGDDIDRTGRGLQIQADGELMTVLVSL